MGPTENIRALAEPLVAAVGLELWDVEVGGGIVRILVDRPDGIDIDVLADASHALSDALDERDDLVPAGRYTLEVSSPGIERTLRTPAQYRRFLGSDVAVKLRAPLAGSRRLRGTLVAASDSAIRLRVEDGADALPETDLTYDQIERTRTVLVWGPAPRSESRSGSAAPAVRPIAPKARERRSVGAMPVADARTSPVHGSATNPKDAS